MYRTVVVHGHIGSGKTTTCQKLAELAKYEGVPVAGIVCVRIIHDNDLIGYDGLDLLSGKTVPLIRLEDHAEGSGWFSFCRLKYVFSKSGFKWANKVLVSSVESLSRPSLVFVDEFGRMEVEGEGLSPGAVKVAEGLTWGCEGR